MIDVPKVRGIICQKILPLTYDESMSYYEFLCKLLKVINEIIEVVNELKPQDLSEIYRRLDAIEAVNEAQQEELDRDWHNIQNQGMMIEELMAEVASLRNRVNNLENMFQSLYAKVYDDHEPRIDALERAMRFFLEPVTVSSMPIEADLYDLSEVTIHE